MCNQAFSDTIRKSKTQLYNTSIFALVNKNELRSAFEAMSRLIAPKTTTAEPEPTVRLSLEDPCLALQVSVVRDNSSTLAKAISATLLRLPAAES